MLGEKVPFVPFVRTLVVSTKLELKPSQLWVALLDPHQPLWYDYFVVAYSAF